MLIGLKQSIKLIGIIIISFCAVFVCTLFLNYNLDIASIKSLIVNEQMMALYNAQSALAKVIAAITGGCLLMTSVVMLFFYIKHFIASHRKELGILKALGYSNFKIAKGFWVFGLGIFIGAATGFAAAFALMPTFYRVMNEEGLLPEYSVAFHPALLLWLVVFPTIMFSALSVLYGCYKLKKPVLELLRQTEVSRNKKRHKRSSVSTKPFLRELRHTTVKSRASLVFFIGFAAFCFAAMMQMSFSMKDLASVMMAVIMILIGIVLACATLFLAVTTVVNANTKTIAMMQAMGYSMRDCGRAILGGYRPVSYVGFAVGTIYQYLLLKVTITVIFKDVGNIPDYNFDFRALFLTLATFILVYELIMYFYSARIKKIAIKEIMLD